jgi:hypothetical protein
MSIVSPEGQAAGLPFAQASPLLRHQALASARQILGAAYYSIAEAQWHQAFEELQLPLYRLGDGPASLSAEGLLALLQYLEARYRLSSTATPSAGPTPPAVPAAQPIKQTYAINPDVATQLGRVSYWCRQPRSRLVNQALAQLLSQYPEASIPVPEE